MIRKNLPVTTAKYLRRLTKIQHACRLPVSTRRSPEITPAITPRHQRSAAVRIWVRRLRARDKVGASVGAAKHQQPHQNQPHL